MALRKWNKSGVRQLTDREIKAEIMKRLGLDPRSAADQHTYKKQLNIEYLRAKAYSIQQGLETPVRPNENWLRRLTREQQDVPLTAEQIGILRTPAISTTRFVERLVRDDPKIEQAAIENLELQFKAFLEKNTYGYEKEYEEFKTREVTQAFLVNNDGEVVRIYNITEGEIPPAYVPIGLELEYEVHRESRAVSYAELKAKLEELADDLHKKQEAKMEGNRAVYGYGRKAYKRVGS